MSELPNLKRPWLLAVWPGMGNVALSAGYYLMAKLGMHVLAEFSPRELFDVDHVEVKNGLIRPGGLPRNRCFVWSDSQQQHDIVIFIGEAQPPVGKYAFCQRLIKFAQELGVERVFTFAAMATQMHPDDDSRVFGAAVDEANLKDLQRLDVEVLNDGRISGLNGVLLSVAAEHGLPGMCMLGEMPHLFAQVPFPKASMAVLKLFVELAEIELDFTELEEQSHAMQQKLAELLTKVERTFQRGAEEEEEAYVNDPGDEGPLTADDERRIEGLFAQARQDRSKAYELKRELDRLDVFREYEDRFLDLFKKPS